MRTLQVSYFQAFACGHFISLLVPSRLAPLVGVVVALVWAVAFSGANPTLPTVWSASPPRRGSVAALLRSCGCCSCC